MDPLQHRRRCQHGTAAAAARWLLPLCIMMASVYTASAQLVPTSHGNTLLTGPADVLRFTLMIDFPSPAPTASASNATSALNVLQKWGSYKDLMRWADQLANDDKMWSPASAAGMTKLRTALAPSVSGGGGIYEKLLKDLSTTSLPDLRILANDPAFPGLPGLSSSADSHDQLTIAFQVGMCGGRRPGTPPIRRLFIDTGVCQELLPSFGRFNSTVLSLINSWVPGQGFRSCESACRDAVQRITDIWSRSELNTDQPTRLALYSPTPLRECTAARLNLQSGLGGSAPAAVDKSFVYADDRFAILIGPSAKTSCPLKVDEALQKLPTADRLQMRAKTGGPECEAHLDSLNWEVLKNVFNSHMNDTANTPNTLWPSFSQIFFANAVHEHPSNTTFASHFASLGCPTLSAIQLLRQDDTAAVSIPVLQVQGPPLEDVHDLLQVSLRMATLNPHQEGAEELSDEVLAHLAAVCKACRDFPEVSFEALFRAAESVNSTAPCRPTVMGGLGERIEKSLEAVQKLIASASVPVEKQGEKLTLKPVQIALSKEFVFAEKAENTSVLHFDRCPSGSTLSLLLPVTTARIKLLSKPLRRRFGNAEVIPFSSIRGPNESFDKISVNLTAEVPVDLPKKRPTLWEELDKSAVAAAMVLRAEGEGPLLEVNVTVGREVYGLMGVSVDISTADYIQLTPLNVTVSCGASPASIRATVTSPDPSPRRSSSTLGAPYKDALTEWIEAIGDLKTRDIDIPTRFHAITRDLSDNSPTQPYLIQDLSFLAGQTPLLLLQSSRHFTPAPPPTSAGSTAPTTSTSFLQLPPALRSRLAMTEPCDAVASTAGNVRPSGMRLVYRTESMDVTTCWELRDEAAEGGGGGRALARTVGKWTPWGGVQVPSVALVRSKKTKQAIAVINVAWTSLSDPEYRSKHRGEARVLLWIMERIRATLGIPLIVGGAFHDDLAAVMSEIMEETGAFRNFHLPDPGFAHSHIWTPTVPNLNTVASGLRASTSPPRHLLLAPQPTTLLAAPHSASRSAYVESCLASTDADDVAVPPPGGWWWGDGSSKEADVGGAGAGRRGGCRDVREYGKWFRKNVGGLLADERMVARRVGCATDVSWHVPVAFKIDAGHNADPLRAVSFHLGRNPLTPSSFRHLATSQPHLLTYLASHDILILQSDVDTASDAADPNAVNIPSLLLDAFKRTGDRGSKKRRKEDRATARFVSSRTALGNSTTTTHPTSLLILVRTTKSRPLGLPRCTATSYSVDAASTPLLACAVRIPPPPPTAPSSGFAGWVGGSATSTGDDLASPSPWHEELVVASVRDSAASPLASATRDLPDADVGVMKRVYAAVCNGEESEDAVKRRKRARACETFRMPAVFAGYWGDAAVGPRWNGTAAEFKTVVEGLEKEVLRKNQIGDRHFPHLHPPTPSAPSPPSLLRIQAHVPPETRTGSGPLHLLYHPDADSPSGMAAAAAAAAEEEGWEGGAGGAKAAGGSTGEEGEGGDAEGSVMGSVFGWIMGTTDVTIAQWPYWTDWRTGSFASFPLTWHPIPLPTTPTHAPADADATAASAAPGGGGGSSGASPKRSTDPDDEAPPAPTRFHVLPGSVSLDVFAGTPACRAAGAGGALAATSRWCRNTRPACWSPGVVAPPGDEGRGLPVGVRVDAVGGKGIAGHHVCALAVRKEEEAVELFA
ncbi:hypothetical protein HDU96_003248 [Phlyctochytrium bullatum]|nr:hypothetical protein HDU96_003248 [Phlyctochytrium bullatum]